MKKYTKNICLHLVVSFARRLNWGIGGTVDSLDSVRQLKTINLFHLIAVA